MKHFSISARNVEFIIGILATALIGLGLLLYMWREPVRIVVAQTSQLHTDLDEAMSLYAENCAVCHGLAGEGIGATPALDNPVLWEMDYAALAKIIARGLFGTSMPAWSKEDGGSLSDYQIDELVTLIQYGDWQATRDRGVNAGIAPLIPFSAEPDPIILDSLVGMQDGDILAQGITLYAQQCVACHDADGLGSSLAPALNDPAVRQKSPDELSRTILNGVPGTLMASWQNILSDADITALVTLMTEWDQVPDGAIPAPERPIPVTEESLALGADLYASSCASCHGPDGQGTMRAPSLNVKSFLTATNDVAIQQIITLGVPGTAMPAWGDRMTEAEIQALVGFIRSWEPTAPEMAEPARGGGAPWWQSKGSQTPGGRTGGPPWLRNGSSSSNSSSLPGGGSIQAANTGNLVAQAGTETASQAHQSSQSGPPWMQTTQTSSTSWWQALDWRVLGLMAGVVLLATILLISGLVGLRRLNSTE
jgi:mono/diheme cytochrome c family protein